MIRRPPRSTQSRSSAASDVYKRPLGDLGAVDSGVVEVLDALAKRRDALGAALPLDRHPVVGPVQIALLVQEREQELAAEPVVVVDAIPGDGEAEEAVEEDRVLDVAGGGVPLGLE